MWVRRFVEHCRAKKIEINAHLTLTGVIAFVSLYSRIRERDPRETFLGAHSALGTWAAALTTLGVSLPVWNEIPEASSSLPPLLREFARHLHEHRGNPAGTIHKKVVHVAKLLAFFTCAPTKRTASAINGHRRFPDRVSETVCSCHGC
jgi:hypothetical protein